MSVDLPAPFSPSSTWTSPAFTSKLTFCSATVPGNRLTMSLTATSVSMSVSGYVTHRCTAAPDRSNAFRSVRRAAYERRTLLRDQIRVDRDEGRFVVRLDGRLVLQRIEQDIDRF